MQSIVYKLVPHLQEEEERRCREFMRQHQAEEGIVPPDDSDEPAAKREKEAEQPIVVDAEGDRISFILSKEENVAEDDPRIKALDKPFIRTSAKATIHTLKKFLAARLGLSGPDELDVLCKGEVLGKEYTLEYILRTRWRKGRQLELSYRSKIDFQIP